MILKKGDPCYVRHEGVIKLAEYVEPSNIPKYHRVAIAFREYNYLLAVDYQPYTEDECRFVCMNGFEVADGLTAAGINYRIRGE